MRDWYPVARGEVLVRGVDPVRPNFLDVMIPLSRVPEDEWIACFVNPIGLDRPATLEEPQLVGSNIEMRPPDDAFEACLRYIDARIANANRRYELDIIPILIHQEAMLAREAADRESRVEQARGKARET